MSGEYERHATAEFGLHPLQEEFLGKFFSSSAPHSDILIAPPGTGKLRTALEAFARSLVELPNRKVAFFSDRVQVVKQAHALFLSTFPGCEAILVDRRKFWGLSEARAIEGAESPWPDGTAFFIPSQLLDFEEIKRAFQAADWAVVVVDGALDGHLSSLVVGSGNLGMNRFVDKMLFLVTNERAVREWPLVEVLNSSRVSVTSWERRIVLGRQPAASFGWLDYERTSPETHLIDVVTNGLERLPDRHWVSIREQAFARTSSSPLALEVLLMTLRRARNMLAHFRGSFDELMAWSTGATNTQQFWDNNEDGAELGGLVRALADALTGRASGKTGMPAPGVHVDREKLDLSTRVPVFLEGLEWVPVALRGLDGLVEDAKLSKLTAWLSEPGNSEDGACILTAFDATAKYVESELSAQGLDVLRISSQDPDLVQTYGSLRDARIVVSTIRQLRGVEHGAGSTVFYDLPEDRKLIAFAAARTPPQFVKARRILVMRPQAESFAWEDRRIRKLS